MYLNNPEKSNTKLIVWNVWTLNQHVRMIFEGSCETLKNVVLAAENSALPSRKVENITFTILLFLLYFWSTAALLSIKDFIQKLPNFWTVYIPIKSGCQLEMCLLFSVGIPFMYRGLPCIYSSAILVCVSLLTGGNMAVLRILAVAMIIFMVSQNFYPHDRVLESQAWKKVVYVGGKDNNQ